MCGVCGCGEVEGVSAVGEHEHVGPDGKVTRHAHGPDGHHHHHGEAAPHGPRAPDDEAARLVRVEQDVLGRNDALAAENRARFLQAGTFVLNLMSSPGSGKTTLLVRTLEALKGTEVAVIEGDQQTSLDADRIRATGVNAVQLNTGRGCHLDAKMVGRALDAVSPPHGVLFIENVGNLVCPAGFDLGETKKVVVVSVTEGEDKPLKYPDMFAVADLVLVNKVDLLPHLLFDLPALEENLQRLKPGVKVLKVSAMTGQGFDAWLAWLNEGLQVAKQAHDAASVLRHAGHPQPGAAAQHAWSVPGSKAERRG